MLSSDSIHSLEERLKTHSELSDKSFVFFNLVGFLKCVSSFIFKGKEFP